MQQLTQKLGSGEMVIQEIPFPQLGKGMVLVVARSGTVTRASPESSRLDLADPHAGRPAPRLDEIGFGERLHRPLRALFS